MNEAMKSEQQDKEWVFSNKSDCLSVERIDSRFFSSSVYFFSDFLVSLSSENNLFVEGM